MCSTEKVGAVSSSGMADAIRVYPELGCLYPELHMAPIFSRLLSHRELSHAAPFSANSAKLNRQTPEIEHLATHRKQTPAICSNRQKINFCLDENVIATGAPSEKLSAFLPGSGLRVEMAVTHSKQSIGAFLPGSRFAHM